MRKIIISLIFGLFYSAAITGLAFAEEESGGLWHVPDYTGNIWDRHALTGDWGGFRTDMADNGITASMAINTTFQSVVDGGTKNDDVFGGSVDYELHLDFQKLGLWPGAFVRVYAETQFGDFINSSTGAGLAANLDGYLPLPDRDITNPTAIMFYQFLAEWFGLYFGKIDTLHGDLNEFAHGDGNHQFLNQNLVINSVTLRTIPVAALGAGLVAMLPGKNNIFTMVVLDANGQPDEFGFEDAFDDGYVLNGELRLEVNPFGLKGHQMFAGTYSTEDFTILDLNLRNLLLQKIFTGGATAPKADDSWNMYYNFDQYLYQEKEDPEQGIGLFGRFGLADDMTSPIERLYSIGIGGQGIIPGRGKDTFGIGYYYVELSDKLPALVHLLAEDSQGMEAFYNIEATPWLHVTLDYQMIDSSLKANETAHVLGLRVLTEF